MSKDVMHVTLKTGVMQFVNHTEHSQQSRTMRRNCRLIPSTSAEPIQCIIKRAQGERDFRAAINPQE